METLTPMNQPPAMFRDVLIVLDDGKNIAGFYSYDEWALRTINSLGIAECVKGKNVLSHCLGWRPIQKGDVFTAIDLADYEGVAVEAEDEEQNGTRFVDASIYNETCRIIDSRLESINKALGKTQREVKERAAEIGRTDAWVERIGGNLDIAEAKIESIQTSSNFWSPIFCVISCAALILSIVAVVLSLS